MQINSQDASERLCTERNTVIYLQFNIKNNRILENIKKSNLTGSGNYIFYLKIHKNIIKISYHI